MRKLRMMHPEAEGNFKIGRFVRKKDFDNTSHGWPESWKGTASTLDWSSADETEPESMDV